MASTVGEGGWEVPSKVAAPPSPTTASAAAPAAGQPDRRPPGPGPARRGRGGGPAGRGAPRRGRGRGRGGSRSAAADADPLAAAAAKLAITVAADGSRTVAFRSNRAPTASATEAKRPKPKRAPARAPESTTETAAVAPQDQNGAEAASTEPPLQVTREDLLKLGPECPSRYVGHYKPHMDEGSIKAEIGSGNLLVGIMKVNMDRPSSATVELNQPSEKVGDKTVCLASALYRSRAYEGDQIAVSILPDQSVVFRNKKIEPSEHAIYARVEGILSKPPDKRTVAGSLRSTGKIGKFLADTDKFVEFWPETRSMPHALIPIGNVPDSFFRGGPAGKSTLAVRTPATVNYVYWDEKVTMPFAVFEPSETAAGES